MTKLDTYTKSGTKGTPTTLPKDLDEKVNMTLLAQAIRVYENRSHPMRAVVKTRGEVKGSTKKIYRQKGTGRARHGARSAPIFVGGSKAHGPRGLKKTLSLPQKMRQKAMKVALAAKLEAKKVAVVSGVSKINKTKEAAKLLKSISDSKKFLIALDDENKAARRFFRNIKGVSVTRFSNLNAYTIYRGGFLIIDKDAFSKKTTTKKKTTKSK